MAGPVSPEGGARGTQEAAVAEGPSTRKRRRERRTPQQRAAEDKEETAAQAPPASAEELRPSAGLAVVACAVVDAALDLQRRCGSLTVPDAVPQALAAMAEAIAIAAPQAAGTLLRPGLEASLRRPRAQELMQQTLRLFAGALRAIMASPVLAAANAAGLLGLSPEDHSEKIKNLILYKESD